LKTSVMGRVSWGAWLMALTATCPAGALIITVKLGKRSKRRGSMAIV
jgi:hypothetical protein